MFHRRKIEDKKRAVKTMVTMVRATGKPVSGTVVNRSHAPLERNWQECPDRNWAAVFGYGKTTGADALGVAANPFPALKTGLQPANRRSAAHSGSRFRNLARSFFFHLGEKGSRISLGGVMRAVSTRPR